MNLQEIIRRLENAQRSIREAEDLLSRVPESERRSSEFQKVKSAIKDVQTRSQVLGAAGDTCPKCGGSGRV